MGYNRLDFEKQIDSGSTRVGDVVFDLNRTLLNGLTFRHLSFDLSDSNLPFAIDLSSGNLILSHPIDEAKSDRLYEFSLSLTEKFQIRFKIHINRVRNLNVKFNLEKGLSQIQKFRASKSCPNNHFIGKLLNFVNFYQYYYIF